MAGAGAGWELFTSGNSFLPQTGIQKNLKPCSVNPLHLGELISTRKMYAKMQENEGVNPLHLGELISTRDRPYYKLSFKCVNPLHLGELISTLVKEFRENGVI